MIRLLLTLLTILALSLPVMAQEELGKELMTNFTYTYEMVFEEGKKPNCKGVIEYDLHMPKNALRMIVETSPRYSLEFPRLRGKKMYHRDDVEDYWHVTEENMPWGVWKRAGIWYLDPIDENAEEMFIWGDTYCNTTFLTEHDLELLGILSTTVGSVQVDPVSVRFYGGMVAIVSHEPIVVTLTDLNGAIIFSGTVQDSIEIPVASRIAILSYMVDDCKITKKLISK